MTLRRAATLVVTTADPAPLAEAARFFEELPEVAAPPVAVIFNRTLPASWAQAEVPARTSAELADNLHRWGAESQRQRDARAGFAARFTAPLCTIPWLAESPTELAGLRSIIDLADGLPRLW